jgi:excisionase family DNA binding protein
MKAVFGQKKYLNFDVLLQDHPEIFRNRIHPSGQSLLAELGTRRRTGNPRG